ncbi:hypothetical protein GCM10009113_10850 [Marinobacter szutsaonensis]
MVDLLAKLEFGLPEGAGLCQQGLGKEYRKQDNQKSDNEHGGTSILRVSNGQDFARYLYSGL